MPRDIKITPKIGDVSAGGEPTQRFQGLNAGPIKFVVNDDGSVTLTADSFGDLMTFLADEPGGLIWAASDKTGLSVIKAFNTGRVVMGRPLFNDVEIDANGNVIMKNLPTSDPGIPGALWNNLGVINVSP